MVDQVNQEEEYHFQDLGDPEQTESSESSFEVPSEEPGDTSAQMKKKVMMAAGGAIVLIVLYNFIFGSFGSKDDQDKDTFQQPKQISSSLPKPISQPKMAAKPKPIPKAEPMPRPVAEPSAPAPETMEQFNRMNTALQSIEYTLRELDTRLVDLQNKQDKLQKEISAKKQPPKPKPAKKAKKARKMPPIDSIYKVLGTIHGRAWLKKAKGSTLTVKPGDNLPGYGSVKLIEPEQGVVIMSTGDVIKFDE